MLATKIDRTAADVLTCAVEGGTNYWAAVSDIQRDDDLNVYGVTYHELDEETGGYRADGKRIRLEDVKRAMRLIAFEQVAYADGCKAVARALVFSGSEEADFDAGDADLIVQVAVLGEVVYG